MGGDDRPQATPPPPFGPCRSHLREAPFPVRPMPYPLHPGLGTMDLWSRRPPWVYSTAGLGIPADLVRAMRLRYGPVSSQTVITNVGHAVPRSAAAPMNAQTSSLHRVVNMRRNGFSPHNRNVSRCMRDILLLLFTRTNQRAVRSQLPMSASAGRNQANQVTPIAC